MIRPPTEPESGDEHDPAAPPSIPMDHPVADRSTPVWTASANLTSTRTGLERRLFESPFVFDFFQAVRILQRLDRTRAPVGHAGPPRSEAVRFRAHLSLGFPPSAIHDLIGPAPDRPLPVLVQAFMGLTGPSGVLPRHYTDLLHRIERDRSERNPEKHALRDWLDLFNHRMVSLFYRAWEKYRFHLAYERGDPGGPDPDPFTQCLYCLIGLGLTPLRDRLRVLAKSGGEASSKAGAFPLARIEDLALLHYGGLFARRLRTAVGLEALVGDYFGIAARVEQFHGHWLALEPANQTCLAGEGGNTQLGVNTVVGQRVWDIQSKFRIRLGPLRYREFLEFVPDRTPLAARKSLFLLTQLVRLYVGPTLDFDVQVVLLGSEAPDCQLVAGQEFGARLGWNTWIRSRSFARDLDDAVFGGQEAIWMDVPDRHPQWLLRPSEESASE